MTINKKGIISCASTLAAAMALGAICACTSHGSGGSSGSPTEERRPAATDDDTSADYGSTPYPAAAGDTGYGNTSGTDDADGKKDGVPLGSCSTEGMSGDRPGVRVNPYYDAGYERGYDDGYLDGEENIREQSYDSSCRYTGHKRRQYKEGYDEGYEAGFDDGYADSGGNPDDEE